MNRKRKGKAVLLCVLLCTLAVSGCRRKYTEEEMLQNTAENNVLITETGEEIEKPEPVNTASPDPVKEVGETEQQGPAVEMDFPEYEQIITEEDQTEPQGHNMQIVFLGDSIFDNNRDGTGVPYLTAEKCDADFYNLAIGGTCASIEEFEAIGSEGWTSTSLCGVVNGMMGKISLDIFDGTRTGELLKNPDIDYTQTDYFVVEYGTNDFFRGVRQSDEEDFFNMRTYAGALRYAVNNLRELAPDATIILCSPMYAQFYHDGYLIGDGNVTNNGNGTLFDYKGTCNYVANEQNTLFLNAYQDLGIDGYTVEEYLEDGVHLTEAGRHLYSDALAQMILSYEETKNN